MTFLAAKPAGKCSLFFPGQPHVQLNSRFFWCPSASGTSMSRGNWRNGDLGPGHVALPDIAHPTAAGPADLGLRSGVTQFPSDGCFGRCGCLQAQARPGECDVCIKTQRMGAGGGKGRMESRQRNRTCRGPEALDRGQTWNLHFARWMLAHSGDAAAGL